MRGSTRSGRPWIARRGHACVVVLSALTMLFVGVVLSTPRVTRACGGTPPRPPAFCSYGYSFGKAVPRVIVCQPGGNVVVPITTFHRLALIGNICPPPPYLVTMSVTLNCVPPPSAGPTVFGPFPIANGNNVIPIGLVVPCSPPRRCTLSIVSTVTFTNGRTITLTGDQVVCIVEEVPGNPGVPRLDLELLSPPTIGTHAGDQGAGRYRLTNNDPVESWTGTLGADFRNTAKQPVQGGPPSPVREAWALADPGPGDNWPIEFDFNLPPGGCIPLPPDPQNQVLSTASSGSITLLPGEVMEFDVLVRPWGMCADGSCGESGVEASGQFSDLTDGIACASAMYYVDNSIPPTFQWDDGGSVPTVGYPNPGAPVVEFVHHPSFFDIWPFQMQMQGPIIGQQPIPPQSAFTGAGAQDLGPWKGRLNSALDLPQGGGTWNVDSFFDIEYRIQFFGPGSEPFVGLQIQPVPGAPAGFENLAPFGMGQVGIDMDDDFAVDSFFDIFYQVSAVAQTDVGPVEVEILSLDLVASPPLPGQTFFDVHIEAVVPSTSGATQVLGMQLMTDLAGYSRPLPPTPCIGDINGDGFTNAADFVILAGAFGSVVPPNTGGDLNGDGLVNAADFVILAGDFGCG